MQFSTHQDHGGDADCGLTECEADELTRRSESYEGSGVYCALLIGWALIAAPDFGRERYTCGKVWEELQAGSIVEEFGRI